MFILTALLLGTLDAAQLEKAVRDAFPPRIAALAEDHRTFGGELAEQLVTFERLPGGNEVVAAYGDGTVGAVRVLGIDETSTRVVAESDLLWSGAPHQASIELLDVDGDGTSEYIVSYPDHRLAESTYVFKRTANGLVLISPVRCHDFEGARESAMLGSTFIDLDGDGRREAVDRRRLAAADGRTEDEMPDWVLVWKLVNGVYTLDIEGAPLFHEFRRAEQQPTGTSFDFPADIQSADLVVVNGGYLGAKGRASSAEIRLNGSVVLAEKDFKQTAGTLRVPVKLRNSNDITVRIAGAPESQLIVYFAPAKKSVGPCRDE